MSQVFSGSWEALVYGHGQSLAAKHPRSSGAIYLAGAEPHYVEDYMESLRRTKEGVKMEGLTIENVRMKRAEAEAEAAKWWRIEKDMDKEGQRQKVIAELREVARRLPELIVEARALNVTSRSRGICVLTEQDQQTINSKLSDVCCVHASTTFEVLGIINAAMRF